MYKVFIDEIPFFFTEDKTILNGFKPVLYQELDLQFFFNETHKNPNAKINVICDNLQDDWFNFTENFEIRAAAGGLVKNSIGEFLWIYRFDKWDLPKGHVEKGESKEIAAIREVEEECNVSGLVIDKEIETTYHIFEYKGTKVLKKTYWFLMHATMENQKLIPQTEEGITKVCFKDKKDSLNCLSNTYGNIKLLFQEVL